MNDLIIYAAPAITLGVGLFLGYREGAKLDAEQSQARATAIKDMADSQARLADALAAKTERLERIAKHGSTSTSGSAQFLAKIARGEA